ncbi:MAG TPA: hypothetical protein DCE41_09960 [Cytophagales bacterium]|nr:hypothetical protein [Cytophagales bacterium]HAP64764.1 hypothetical protein [Cytophagales bacterium]
MKIPPPYLYKDGSVDLCTGIVTLNFSLKDTKSKLAEKRENNTWKTEGILDTIQHEISHFIQLFTCSYVYKISQDLWDSLISFAQKLEQRDEEELELTLVRELAQKHIGQLPTERLKTSKVFPLRNGESITVRIIDLVECFAIMCSYRFNAVLPDKVYGMESFFTWCSENHFDSFLAPVKVAEHFYGGDTFSIFTQLCYWCLNSKDPLEAFEILIKGMGISGLIRKGNPNYESFQRLIYNEQVELISLRDAVYQNSEKANPYLLRYFSKFINL